MSAPQEKMDRPWRLVGIIAPGIAIALIARLLAANGVSELEDTKVITASGVGCLAIGLGLCLIASRRDRFDISLWSLSVSTALAFAAVTWISPPFVEDTRVWDNNQQAALAFVGLGVGFVIAGIIALAMVRRRPTPTIALTLIAAVLVVAASTLWLRSEWEGIAILAVAFATLLLAWDRSPRRERVFAQPDNPPRTSRAALTLTVFVLSGTAIQLYISRDGVPRGLPAVVLSGVLVVTAFTSIYRLRRELQNRETKLSEWRSWTREVRTNDFQDELEGFSATPPVFDLPSHPELDIPSVQDEITVPLEVPIPEVVPAAIVETPAAIIVETPEPAPASDVEVPRINLPRVDGPIDEPAPMEASAFATEIGGPGIPEPAPLPPSFEPEASPIPAPPLVADGDGPKPATIANGHATSASPGTPAIGAKSELQSWLTAEVDSPPNERLFLAIETITLAQHDALTPAEQQRLRAATAVALRSAEPDAELISWIDGPYFVLAYRSISNRELNTINKRMQRLLHSTVDDFELQGTLAMLRSDEDTGLDSLIDEAVIGLIQSRQIEAATRRATS